MNEEEARARTALSWKAFAADWESDADLVYDLDWDNIHNEDDLDRGIMAEAETDFDAGKGAPLSQVFGAVRNERG